MNPGEQSRMVTLADGLHRAAQERPRGDFTFIADDLTENVWTFPELRRRSLQVASGLQQAGLRRGDRVALMVPQPDEFVPSFLGSVLAGGVPVPMYPPLSLGQLGGYLDHARHIVGASAATFVITNRQIKAVVGTLGTQLSHVKRISTVQEVTADADLWQEPRIALEDTCFIQFTSGSTSMPKGVVVSHGNLAHNAHCIIAHGLDPDPDRDRGVSWLPLFHDMGLIGFVIAPVLHQVSITFMSPVTFLKRPMIWLETLAKYPSSMTYGPNFAYALAAKRARPADLKKLDLSGVKVAGCGAEPIQAATLRAFLDKFAPVGFRERAFVPSYGMAEATLAISFARGIQTDTVVADDLWTRGKATPADHPQGQGTVEIVNCGGAFPGHGMRIVHPETGDVLADRLVGEIQVQGPSVMAGYDGNPEKTRETLLDGGWLRTGDLGYLVNGEVFICGRQKDVIIVHGKNYYPQDLEWVASHVDGIRTGNAIAFVTHRDGVDREAVVVVAETKEDPSRWEVLSSQVSAAVKNAVGLQPDHVMVVEAGTLPKTSSGKVQRNRARELYERGELKRQKDEGKAQMAARVVQSQWAHLRLRIFGSGSA